MNSVVRLCVSDVPTTDDEGWGEYRCMFLKCSAWPLKHVMDDNGSYHSSHICRSAYPQHSNFARADFVRCLHSSRFNRRVVSRVKWRCLGRRLGRCPCQSTSSRFQCVRRMSTSPYGARHAKPPIPSVRRVVVLRRVVVFVAQRGC
jgi:hypothetical protein